MTARSDYPAEPGRSDDLVIHVDHYNAAMIELDALRAALAKIVGPVDDTRRGPIEIVGFHGEHVRTIEPE